MRQVELTQIENMLMSLEMSTDINVENLSTGVGVQVNGRRSPYKSNVSVNFYGLTPKGGAFKLLIYNDRYSLLIGGAGEDHEEVGLRPPRDHEELAVGHLPIWGVKKVLETIPGEEFVVDRKDFDYNSIELVRWNRPRLVGFDEDGKPIFDEPSEPAESIE